MKINQQEIEKLSIADIVSMSAMLGTKEEQGEQLTKEDVFFVAALEHEYNRRVAKLTAPAQPFDFPAWLLANGWDGGHDDVRKQTVFEKKMGEDFFRLLYNFNSDYFSIICGRLYVIQDCLIPSVAAESETLFKLFRL